MEEEKFLKEIEKDLEDLVNDLQDLYNQQVSKMEKEFAEDLAKFQDLKEKNPEIYLKAQQDWIAGQKDFYNQYPYGCGNLHGYGYLPYGEPYLEKQDQDLHIWSYGSSLDIEDPE